MRDEVPALLVVLLLLLACVGAVVWLVRWADRESARWTSYASEHHCHAVSQSQDLVMYPIACGKDCMTMVPMFVPRTTYRCDGDEYVTR